jgi:hypothetical protein
MLIPKLDETLIPKNKIETKNNVILPVNENNFTDFRELYMDVLDEEKALTDYTKQIVKMVRSSYEYRKYIKLLKTEFDLTKCAFFKNIDIMDVNKISFEMHHYPFTIFDIISIVIQNRIKDQKEDPVNKKKFDRVLNPFSISKEVLRLHYEGKVGLVPLTITPHELYHAGELFIPLTDEFVFGNYDKFIEEYNAKDYSNYKEVLNLIQNKTNEIIDGETELDLSKLQIKKVYLEMQNTDFLEKIKLEEMDEVA